jgi:hypothetical protein
MKNAIIIFAVAVVAWLLLSKSKLARPPFRQGEAEPPQPEPANPPQLSQQQQPQPPIYQPPQPPIYQPPVYYPQPAVLTKDPAYYEMPQPSPVYLAEQTYFEGQQLTTERQPARKDILYY